jgi:tetratricopeptide (TPR) repeat protein
LLAVGIAVFSLTLLAVALYFRSTRTPIAQRLPDDAEATGRYITPSDTEPKPAAPARDPVSAAEFYERGGYHFSARDYDSAIRDFRRSIELQENFPSAHNRLGRALMAKGLLPEAAEQFRKAIDQKNGNYYAAQYNLGYALQQQGDTENAIKAYDAAIAQRDGVYPDAFYQKGLVLLGLKRDAEAAEALNRAIEQNNQKDADANQALGVAFARQEQFDKAEAAFLRAIEQRAGDFPEAHYNLGTLYQSVGRLPDAVKAYETALKQNPKASDRVEAERRLRELRRKVASEGAK